MLITHEADVAQRAARVVHMRDGLVASDDASGDRRGSVAVNWGDTLRNAWDAIRTHKLRSVLTSLGILIGIAAVVLTVGLGQGAQQQVSSQLSALGGNLLHRLARQLDHQRGARRLRLGGDPDHRRRHGADLLERRARHRGGRPGRRRAVRRHWSTGRTNWTTTVVGTTAPWLSVRGRAVASGRFLTAADEAGAAAVVVLGSDTATELFGPLDPVGQTVTINGVDYQVVGVLASAGSDSTTNLDDQAIVPISTAPAAHHRRDEPHRGGRHLRQGDESTRG